MLYFHVCSISYFHVLKIQGKEGSSKCMHIYVNRNYNKSIFKC